MDQPFFIALAAISGVLVIINLFGNTLVCVVILRNRNVRTPLNYLLFTLAVTDALIGFFSIPMSVFGFIPNETEGTAAMLLRKLLAKGNLIHPFSQVSTFSLAAIAFDRYQAVVHPLRVREKITRRKTFLFIIITWILAISTSIPWIFGLDLGGVPQKCKIKAEYREYLLIHSYIFGVFAYGFTLVVMIVLYRQVIRQFMKKQNQVIEQNQQVAFRTKKRIAAMLITVTLIFATLWAVGTAFVILHGYSDVKSIIIFLFLINSSINWVLYALFSKHFRNCFKRALCSCSKTHEATASYPRIKEKPKRRGIEDTGL